MAGIIKTQKLSFKLLLLACAIAPFTSQAQKLYEVWYTGSDELIYKEIATHRIVDKDLIDLIVEYDKMYSQFITDSLRGITVYCDISSRTITYSVSYTAGIGGESPILLCEPINGREVHICFSELYKQVQLPYQHSVEFLKKSHPKQYEDYVVGQKESIELIGEGVGHRILVTSSFVEWKIVYDKYTGECISKDTPDVTKRYKKYRRRYSKREE